MLTGWPPFYDKNLRKMCEQILKSDLAFPPSCTASPEARDLIRGLLMRDPNARLGSRAGAAAGAAAVGGAGGGVEDIKAHPFFRGLDWGALERREIEPPFRPSVASETDITNFDSTFTSEPAELTPPDPSELSEAQGAGDEFSDFGFVNTSKLKSTLAGVFGLGRGGGRDEDEESDTEDAGVARPGAADSGAGSGAAAAAAGGGAAAARISHRDAPVSPELAAHLQRLALETGAAGPAGAP